MCTEEEKLHDFLSEIQLEQFYYLIVRNLHLTRIAHFDHVEEIDLTGIGMSKPEQRRLFDHLKKYKKPSIKKFFKVWYGMVLESFCLRSRDIRLIVLLLYQSSGTTTLLIV